MTDAFEEKSTVEEIRARFDADVERFSNLETGQSAAMDSPFCLDLIAEASAVTTPQATHLLDIGCGAGNYSLQILNRIPNLNVTLLDLSQPMLTRARHRVEDATDGEVVTVQGDVRQQDFGADTFDIIVAASVLHHLRDEAEWQTTFGLLFRWLKPGGWFWCYDLIAHRDANIQAAMQARYGIYLSDLKDETYRDHVFDYIEREDSPRSLDEQLRWLMNSGFGTLEILHKNSCFAAFGAQKP